LCRGGRLWYVLLEKNVYLMTVCSSGVCCKSFRVLDVS